MIPPFRSFSITEFLRNTKTFKSRFFSWSQKVFDIFVLPLLWFTEILGPDTWEALTLSCSDFSTVHLFPVFFLVEVWYVFRELCWCIIQICITKVCLYKFFPSNLVLSLSFLSISRSIFINFNKIKKLADCAVFYYRLHNSENSTRLDSSIAQPASSHTDFRKK